MTATALRPLGIGEILDTGIKIHRANAATLIKARARGRGAGDGRRERVTASADSARRSASAPWASAW
jgi:hypothetical protein